MVSSVTERGGREQRPTGIEYHGVAGASDDCQSAVVRLMQGGVRYACVRIVTAGTDPALLLATELGDAGPSSSGWLKRKSRAPCACQLRRY